MTMSFSPSDRPSPDPCSDRARALNYRYFHTGRFIVDREQILCLVDARPGFVEMLLSLPEERLRLKHPSSQEALVNWYIQTDPTEEMLRFAIQAITTHLARLASPEDASSPS
jgi:hypothetical protein